MTDSDLLRFYVEKGHSDAARWNLSPECAYLDYRLRTWAKELIVPCHGIRVCNVGIGVGEWDDFLGYHIDGKGQLVSIDVDEMICDVFRLRQEHEKHPNSAQVINADLLKLPALDPFDVITMIGSTAGEIGEKDKAIAVLAGLLAPGARLILMDVGDQKISTGDCEGQGLSWLDTRQDDNLSELSIHLLAVERSVSKPIRGRALEARG